MEIPKTKGFAPFPVENFHYLVRDEIFPLKGYIRYKTITSKRTSKSHVRHRLIIFLFYRKDMFRSQNIQIIVF